MSFFEEITEIAEQRITLTKREHSSESHALRKKQSKMWAQASDADLEDFSREMVRQLKLHEGSRLNEEESFKEILEEARRNREDHIEKLKNPRRW